MKKNLVLALAVVLVFLVGSPAMCAGQNESDEIVIGFSMHTASSFFDGVYSGVEAYVNEFGGRVINVDGISDANYLLGVIEDFIAQEVDAVIYTPVDSVAATPALRMLKDAGIPVINIDSAVEAYDLIDAFVATDNYIDAITPHGFEVAVQLDAGVTPEKGMSCAEDAMQAHPDLSAIFVICDDSAQGAYAAIKSSGLNIPLYSVNGGPESKAAFRADGVDGVWKSSPAQSPYTIGYKGTEAAYKILRGEKIEKEIFIPSFSIDASNVADYPGDWQ